MVNKSTAERVRKRGEASPGFAAERRRQARVVAAADRRDKALIAKLDDAAADLDALIGRQ